MFGLVTFRIVAVAVRSAAVTAFDKTVGPGTRLPSLSQSRGGGDFWAIVFAELLGDEYATLRLVEIDVVADFSRLKVAQNLTMVVRVSTESPVPPFVSGDKENGFDASAKPAYDNA
eukprot:5758471-Pleurochrysis_carterae.AAC.1